MKDIHILSLATGLAAGALVMYYLDPGRGARRRALVRDTIVGAGHDAADFAQAKGKRAADRVKGVMATGHLDRVTRHEPESDAQLHDRIRSRIGRVISHPKSVQVEVRQGRVALTGHVFTSELDDLLREVEDMAGVTALEHHLACHDSDEGIPEFQGSTQPPGRQAQPAQTS